MVRCDVLGIRTVSGLVSLLLNGYVHCDVLGLLNVSFLA